MALWGSGVRASQAPPFSRRRSDPLPFLFHGNFSICESGNGWLRWNMTAAENKFLKEAVKQGLRMQHRFLAEPVLARTGKGYLKSEGVTTLQRIKAGLKKSKSH
jgi:hypothetical protein